MLAVYCQSSLVVRGIFKIEVPLKKNSKYTKGLAFIHSTTRWQPYVTFQTAKSRRKNWLKRCQPIHLYPVLGSGILFGLPPLIMTLKVFVLREAKNLILIKPMGVLQ